ncbi:MAG: SEC-C domain-containing protein [Staphylococcus warneri]|nr:SEC-C domain-containing protein [Staphylococcus warneri]
MLFVSAQDIPTKQIKDDITGKINIDICLYNERTVKYNEQLGFKPMWAVPVTTFKKTFTDIFLTAPNYPQMFVVFETDDFVAIDKIKHYQNVRDGISEEVELPIVDINDYESYDHLEFCLNIETLSSVPIIAYNLSCLRAFIFGNDIKPLDGFMFVDKFEIDEVDEALINDVLIEHLNRIPKMNLNSIKHQYELKGFDNTEERAMMVASWYLFKFTILPIFLKALCSDTGEFQNKRIFNYDFLAFESVFYQYHQMIKLDIEFTKWSESDCTKEYFDKIYKKFESLVIDDDNLWIALFETNGHINRNDLCPCQSGKKFKKCHGLYMTI